MNSKGPYRSSGKEKKLLSGVHVLRKTENRDVSCRSRVATAKKCTKMHNARYVPCCFANLNLLLSHHLLCRALLVVVAYSP